LADICFFPVDVISVRRPRRTVETARRFLIADYWRVLACA